MKRILFLCHGNICRSPMAEFIMKELTKERTDIAVESMAVTAEEIGNGMYPQAAETLRKHNIPFYEHHARQITKEDYDRFDLFLVMETYNLPRLLSIIGADPEHKVYRLLDFTDSPRDIEDPWYSGRFEVVYQQIKTGCEALLKQL